MPFIRNQLKGKMSHTKLTFMSFFFLCRSIMLHLFPTPDWRSL